MTTIKDIATEVNISHQVVSAVLNNKTNCRVSLEKRKKILEVANKLGYSKNFGYKLMHGKKTDTIAVISASPEIEHEEYVQTLLINLLSEINKLGYATYFSNSFTIDPKKNLIHLFELISRGVEHFIFIGSPSGYLNIEKELVRHNLPYIGFKSLFKRNLDFDSIGGSEEIIRFLLAEKKDNFKLLLPFEKETQTFPESFRFMALCRIFPECSQEELCERFVIPVPVLNWNEKDFRAEIFRLGYLVTEKAMKLKPKPEALFYRSDNYALGGVSFLHEHNYEIGKDVLLAGFNNIDAVRFHPFPISSVEHDTNGIVEILAREVLRSEPFSETFKAIVHIRRKR